MGTTKIKITSAEDESVFTEITVNVEQGNVKPTGITVSNMRLTKGASGKLTPTFSPITTTLKKVTYKVEDKSVFSIDNDGNYSAGEAGETKVTVTSAEDSEVFCVFYVYVS